MTNGVEPPSGNLWRRRGPLSRQGPQLRLDGAEVTRRSAPAEPWVVEGSTPREEERSFSAGQGYVGQTSFLGEFGGCGRVVVGQLSFSTTYDNHVLEFESLGPVNGTERHRIERRNLQFALLPLFGVEV